MAASDWLMRVRQFWGGRASVGAGASDGDGAADGDGGDSCWPSFFTPSPSLGATTLSLSGREYQPDKTAVGESDLRLTFA